MLQSKGARVAFADPHVAQLPAHEWAGGTTLHAVPMNDNTIASFDCVVIVTDHRAFDYDAIVRGADVIVDTRNAIKGSHPHVFRLGAPVVAQQGGRAQASKPVSVR